MKSLMQIANRTIGAGQATLVIAEVAQVLQLSLAARESAETGKIRDL